MENWRKNLLERKKKREREENTENDDDLYIPLRKRKKLEEQELKNQFLQPGKHPGKTVEKESIFGPLAKKSLYKLVSEIKKTEPKKSLEEINLIKEEKLLLNVSIRKALIPQGVIGKEIKKINWGWKSPRFIENMSKEELQRIRDDFCIVSEGQEIPNPILKFEDLKLPFKLCEFLRKKMFYKPTPIQCQGIPIILSGRDLIGISYTGSGKTLTFVIPMIMISVLEETRLKVTSGEGPFCLVLVPNRELAKQIYDVTMEICTEIFPFIRAILCMGGTSFRDQDKLILKGFHICIATPGRLIHMLQTNRFNLDLCKYICLDEADRLVDLGFEKSMRTIFDFFTSQKQTVLFSATMPPKIQNFAKSALINPIVVNIGRPGASSMNIRQEFVYCDEEEKFKELLNTLQKTGPPVLVFSSDKNEVDDIFEFLLLKGVSVTAIHGSKDQVERNYAISSFKQGKKDVLVATGIASKGLDFENVKHVINFDFPKDIQTYVHRIGRTGRWGRKGISTTFLNFHQNELSSLLDLKHLLIEAKQTIPEFISRIKEPTGYRTVGCSYCGGLGHTITNCRKLVRDSKKNLNHTESEY